MLPQEAPLPAFAGKATTRGAFAQEAPTRVPPSAWPPKVVAIDDCEMQREMHKEVLQSYFAADLAQSCVLGGTAAEQDAFVAVAMGVLDAQLRPVAAEERRAADVAIIDNQILRPALGREAAGEAGRSPVLGTDLARELHNRGFRGVVCLYTAESGEQAAALEGMPGVDAVFEKGVVTVPQLVEQIRELLASKAKAE
jgi:hypothetical protein